jgi:hypothetical protein
MRRILILVGAMLFLSISATAQGPAGVGAGTRSGSRSSSTYELSAWQLAIGYEYNRINLTGTPFSTHGLDTTITRYFGRWFGVDGQVGVGFLGNTGATTVPPNLGVHSIFVGGGPRIAYRGRGSFEPWLHCVVGLQDFRFTETAGVLGNNRAFGGAAGGGVDFLLGRHLALRVEADALESRFFSMNQRHFKAIAGFAFNF